MYFQWEEEEHRCWEIAFIVTENIASGQDIADKKYDYTE